MDSSQSADQSCDKASDDKENNPPGPTLRPRKEADSKPKKPARPPKQKLRLSGANSEGELFSGGHLTKDNLNDSLPITNAKPKSSLNPDAEPPPVVFPLPAITRRKTDSIWVTTTPIYVADSRADPPYGFPTRVRNLMCFICGKQDENNLTKCSTTNCSVRFHMDCARKYTGGNYTFDFMQRNKGIHCSRHHCAQCFADHNRVRCFNGELISCSQCELSWHTECIPGGCVKNSKKEIICPRHIAFRNPNLHILHCADCQQKPEEDETLVRCNNCLRSLHFKCFKECSHYVVDEDSDRLREKAICNWCIGFDFVRYNQYCMARLGTTRWYPCKVVSNDKYPKQDDPLLGLVGHLVVEWLPYRGKQWWNILPYNRIVPMSESDYFFVSEAKKSGIYEEWDAAQKEVIKNSPEHSIPLPGQINPNYSNGELFRKIMKCKYTAPETRPSNNFKKNTDLCNCAPDAANRCGPASNCLNRQLRLECPSSCEKISGGCNNRTISSGKSCVKVSIRLSKSNRYFGAFADEWIPKHAFVGEYVGEIITKAEKQRRVDRLAKLNSLEAQYYLMDLDNNRAIDAHYYGNDMRYLNHSCDPNCVVQVVTSDTDEHMVLVALRNIEKGEELSFDYNMYSPNEGRGIQQCLCKAKNCTGVLAKKVSKSKTSTASAESTESANSSASSTSAASSSLDPTTSTDKSKKRGRPLKEQNVGTRDQSKKLSRLSKQLRLETIEESDD